jgi:hypothetical protein
MDGLLMSKKEGMVIVVVRVNQCERRTNCKVDMSRKIWYTLEDEDE